MFKILFYCDGLWFYKFEEIEESKTTEEFLLWLLDFDWLRVNDMMFGEEQLIRVQNVTRVKYEKIEEKKRY